jgi:predicted acyl esterase
MTGTGNDGQEFISDPKKPVPLRKILIKRITPRKYMTDDQRFAARRPDVLVYETEILKDNMTLAGDIWQNCRFQRQERMQIGCKVIDVFPNDEPETPEVAPYLK